MHSANDFGSLASPESVALIAESLPQVLREVHSSLVIEAAPCLFVELWAQELKVSTLLLGFFASELNLETWLQDCEVLWDSEVELEHGHVSVESEPEDWRSRWVPYLVLKVIHLGILV
jgi:hypothetical protein